jgi:hypothetical protein
MRNKYQTKNILSSKNIFNFQGKVTMFSLRKMKISGLIFHANLLQAQAMMRSGKTVGYFWGIDEDGSIGILTGKDGTPGQIRTADLLIRSQTLYPAELRAHRI